jgi:hypothetical protein
MFVHGPITAPDALAGSGSSTSDYEARDLDPLASPGQCSSGDEQSQTHPRICHLKLP